MIDAYEIGIQLALQDGVSDGLATISRELAQVDHLIAATNSGLLALTAAAESTVKGVSALAGKPRSSDVQQQTPQQHGEFRTDRREAKSSVPYSAQGKLESDGRPELHVDAPVAVVAPGVPSADAPDLVMQGSSASESTAKSGSATSPGTFAPITVNAAANPTYMEWAAEGGQSPPERQEVPVQSATAHTYTSSIVQPGPAAPLRADLVSRKDRADSWRLMTASVGQAVEPVAGSRAEGHPDRADVAPSGAVPRAADQRWSPDWQEPTRRGRVPSVARPAEPAVAPQPQPRESGEGITGSVMLDGRLVGYWLSEQMAREVAKPPGGTTFFDPRQAPAWNPSGAI